MLSLYAFHQMNVEESDVVNPLEEGEEDDEEKMERAYRYMQRRYEQTRIASSLLHWGREVEGFYGPTVRFFAELRVESVEARIWKYLNE